ncbi:MAG TPA: gamma-glutamylcyclotransferase [Clostridiales bacterium]|jgi:hypothetical protein|nr:gamma-glutamylcyclotransferase [Clostridiales bacterium]
MDAFLSQKFCDRCGKELTLGKITSMYNNDCICLECKRKERERADYKDAVKAVHEEEIKGNRNFEGIGFKGPP